MAIIGSVTTRRFITDVILDKFDLKIHFRTYRINFDLGIFTKPVCSCN